LNHEKIIILFELLLCVCSVKPQVASHIFEGKDAFGNFPVLKQRELKEIPTRQMQPVDVAALLKEDLENEGLDIPFRFGYGFDVNYTMAERFSMYCMICK
jgi:hypothetical protein